MTLIIIIGALILALDSGTILRERSWKIIAAFLFLFIPAVTLSVLSVLNIDVPSVMMLLGEALKALGIGYE